MILTSNNGSLYISIRYEKYYPSMSIYSSTGYHTKSLKRHKYTYMICYDNIIHTTCIIDSMLAINMNMVEFYYIHLYLKRYAKSVNVIDDKLKILSSTNVSDFVLIGANHVQCEHLPNCVRIKPHSVLRYAELMQDAIQMYRNQN